MGSSSTFRLSGDNEQFDYQVARFERGYTRGDPDFVDGKAFWDRVTRTMDPQFMVDNPHLPWNVNMLTKRAPLELFDAHPDLVIARLVAAEDDIGPLPPPFVYQQPNRETYDKAYLRYKLNYPRRNTWNGLVLRRKTHLLQEISEMHRIGVFHPEKFHSIFDLMVSTPRRPWNWNVASQYASASFMLEHPEAPWTNWITNDITYDRSLFYENMDFTWRKPYWTETDIDCIPAVEQGYRTWSDGDFAFFLSLPLIFRSVFHSKYRFTRGDLWKLFKGNKDQFDKFADYLDTHGYDLTADQNQVVDGIKSLMRDAVYTSRQDMVLHRRSNRGGWVRGRRVDNTRNAPV